MRLAALTIALFIAWPALVAAEEPRVGLPVPQFIDLGQRAELVAILEAENKALRAKIESLEQRDALRDELERLKDQKFVLQSELTQLAEQSAASWKKAAEDIESRSRHDLKLARVQAYAAGGALAGTLAFPGIGTLIGGAIGAAIGFVVP